MNYADLVLLVDGKGPLDGFRAWTEESITKSAERAGTSRQSVVQCLTGVRTYKAVRRALEVAYGLPVYSMDDLLRST